MSEQIIEGKLDQQLFEELIKKYGAFVFKYIYSLVKHKETAEDLYQDTLLTAFISSPAVEDPKKFKSWLFKIAINKCRDYWRKQKSQTRFYEEGCHQYVKAEKQPQVPEECLIQMYERKEVMGTINKLPEDYREPLFLFYYENRTLLEISNDTKVPLSTIKTRIRRGKQKIMPRMKILLDQ